MIDSSPRPLPQKRLEQLVRGLRQRTDGSQSKTAEQVETLHGQIRAIEQQYAAGEAEKMEAHSQQKHTTTTEWDVAVHECWDKAELRAYRAIYDSADKEGKLRIQAREAIEHATNEAKKRIVEIEQRFLQAKNVPIKKLNGFRSQNQAMMEQLSLIENAANKALAQRSLRAPTSEDDALALDSPDNTAIALERIQGFLKEAKVHADRLANNRLAKFFESLWWWSFCGLTFLAVTVGIRVAELAPFVTAVLVGAGSTVVVLLLGFVGIRPWLKRSAAAEYPKVQKYSKAAKKMMTLAEQVAIEENDQELKRLAAKRDERFEQAKAWRDQQVVEVTGKLDTSIRELRAHAIEQKELARTQLSEGLVTTDQRYEERMSCELGSCNQELERLKLGTETRCKELQSNIERLQRGGALRMQIAMQKALQVLTRSRRWCNEYFPSWQDLESADPQIWPAVVDEPVLQIGNLPIDGLLPENAKRDVRSDQLSAPFLYSPLQDEYLVIEGDPSQTVVANLVRGLVMRALTTLPAGKTQVCVVDPPGLGRDFGWLMHLGDFDPQLVTHRVWTQTGHIAKQISALALAAEDFIQQSLRNQYQNIVQYNQDAGALSEPFRILVWSSLPSGLDDQSWKGLKSILDTGARCGIIPILIVDPNVGWQSADQRAILNRRGLHLRVSEDGKSLIANSKSMQEMAVVPAPAPSDEQAQQIIQEVGRRALLSNRVEVPLDRMVPEKEDRWHGNSSHSLEIPIGQSGVGRTHALRLGIGTAQHAIIAGKTGSGKSSLLHAMITSALLKYSPECLRVVLLDFKKGVEFQVYSDAAIPHADIIGIESHREFGLSALEFVDDCMQRRGESFRRSGVQDLASWNALHPDQPIPRMLLVVDEFQELFVEDDKLSGQASLILDRIVRQGRSFGVHAVLSSQTLAGAYSLPRTTLGQMAVRIALQCDPSDAQIIFAEDNPAASRLKHPGQAVYNDAGGRIEGNQPMQIGWLPKKKQVEWFAEFESGYRNSDRSTNRLGRTVVYDGNRAAVWSDHNANLAVEYARNEINPDARWCVAGESVAINPAVVFPLTQQAGRNAIIVGADDAQAAAVLNVVTSSFVRSASQTSQTASLFVVQGAKPTDARTLALPKQWEQLDCSLKVADVRSVDDILDEVHQILQQRQTDEQESDNFPPVLLNLLQIGRLRSLKKEDDFGFGESELTPAKKLEEVLRDGPGYGVHTLIWAEGYSTVNRWLSRNAMREIEIRMLMQMSSNDSTNLIDSISASRLGEHVMLLSDEATGQEQRFRPFATNSLDSLPQWANK